MGEGIERESTKERYFNDISNKKIPWAPDS
jgi:hypothetical protein